MRAVRYRFTCASFADGGKESRFILEVPIRGGPRNTELFGDLSQSERVNPLVFDQFEAAFY